MKFGFVKKVISVLLILVMLFCALPVTVNAETEGDTTATGETTATIESDSGLGGLISNSLEETQEEEKDIQNCVLEVTVAENIATVKFNNAVDCKIIVAIYDEQTQLMVGSGMAEFEANTESADITLDIDTMPEFFVVRAYLLDTENKPLHKSYESIEYTKAHQEFLATTVNEFEEETVLNFDESEDNNFAVFADNTVVLYEADGVNNVASVDDETKTYIFENAEDTLLNIAAGIPFYYEALDGTAIMGVVESVVVNGTTVTVAGDADAALDDVFEFVKIDTTSDGSGAEIDMTEADEGIEYLGEFEQPSTYGLGDVDVTKKVAHSWSVERDLYSKGEGTDESFKVKIKGEIGIALSANFKAHVYFDYCSVEFSLKEETSFEVGISGKLENKVIKLAKITVPTGVPSVSIGVDFDFVAEVSGAVEYTGIEYSTMGFKFDTRVGKFEDISIPSKAETELKFEGKLFIGLKVSPKVSALGEIIELSAPFKAGIEYKLESVTIKNTYDVKHACGVCMAGTKSKVFSVDVKLTVKIKLGKIELFDFESSKTLCSIKSKMNDFYVSSNKYGLGSCPNNLYRTTFIVVDSSGKAIANATVGNQQTNSQGVVNIYLSKGTHEYNVSKTGYIDKRIKFEVKGAGYQKIVLYGMKKEENLQDVIGDQYGIIYKKGKCGENVNYTLYNSGFLVIDGNGSMCDGTDWRNFDIDLVKNIVIKSGVTSIGIGAFSNYRNLTNVVIPNSVTRMYDSAFMYCTTLTSVTIPASVASIGSSVFEGCVNLMNVNISNGVTDIGGYAFSDCSKLSEIIIPQSVTNIEYCAFYNCSSLKSVTIPANVQFMGTNIFFGCSSLINVFVDDNNKMFNDINGVLFNKENTELILYPAGKDGDKYVIPNSVTYIGPNAFSVCDKLKSINISDSVTIIDFGAFSYCCNLTSVIIPNSVSNIGSSAFYNCSGLVRISIPISVKYIEQNAFYKCDKLKVVYYGSSKNSWDKINIETGNTQLTDATIYYNSVMPVAASENVAMFAAYSLAREEGDAVEVLSETVEETTDETTTGTVITQDDLVPNEVYVLMVVLGYAESYEITTDTLLYITDVTADVDGCAEFEYFVDDTEPYVVLMFGECNHCSTEWIESCVPSCTEQGVNVNKCIKCDDVLEIKIVAAEGHSLCEWVKINDATIAENGVFEQYCSECDYTNIDEYVYLMVENIIVLITENGKAMEAVIDGKYAEQFATLSVAFTQNGQETIVADYTVNGNNLVFDYIASTDDIVSIQLTAITAFGNTVTANAIECNLARFNGQVGTKYVQYTELAQGDANGDGVTDVKDLVRTKKMLAELADKTDNADISGDGSVATADLVLLAKYIISGTKGMMAHTVTFADADGSTLLTMLVPEGFGAKPNVVPQKDGYTFAGWDKESCNVTSDVVVKAIYNKNDVTLDGTVGEDWEYGD